MSTPRRDVRLAVARMRAARTLLYLAHEMAPRDAAATEAYCEAVLGFESFEAWALNMLTALNEAASRRAKGRKRRAA